MKFQAAITIWGALATVTIWGLVFLAKAQMGLAARVIALLDQQASYQRDLADYLGIPPSPRGLSPETEAAQSFAGDEGLEGSLSPCPRQTQSRVSS